jgi:hypothetical protein
MMTLATWTAIDARTSSLGLERDGVALSWAEVVAGLISDPTLRAVLTDALVAAPFAAFYWEARPVGPDELDVPFTSVVLDAPALAIVEADVEPFVLPLAGAQAPAVCFFPNLGGDAELVVPAPEPDPSLFPHFAAFLRRAGAPQIDALWLELGLAIDRWLTTRRRRVWVSTSGGGVAWLHLRLDTRPKYVKWGPYRAAR